MKVIVAEQAGVCFGVRRALDLVNKEAQQRDELSTLGPLIHNPQVVKMLEEQGVRVVKDVAEAKVCVVLPSHGVTREVLGAAQEAGLEIVDATCPFVANVHKRARALAEGGYSVVVVGDEGHSEVKGIKSAAGGNTIVISSPEEVDGYSWQGKKVGVVCQTTKTPESFGEIVGKIAARAKEVQAFNTICYATQERQRAAAALAPQVDVMIVVGGRNSANTTRLAEICGESGVRTYHIETADEIREEWLTGSEVVGVTAGASTPQWIIDDVKKRLEQIGS